MSLFSEPWPNVVARSAIERSPLAPIDAILAFQFSCACDSCAVDKMAFWVDAVDPSTADRDRQQQSIAEIRKTVRPHRREWPISARMLLTMGDVERVDLVQRYKVDFDCKAVWAVVDDLVSRGMGENLVTKTEWREYQARRVTRKGKR